MPKDLGSVAQVDVCSLPVYHSFNLHNESDNQNNRLCSLAVSQTRDDEAQFSNRNSFKKDTELWGEPDAPELVHAALIADRAAHRLMPPYGLRLCSSVVHSRSLFASFEDPLVYTTAAEDCKWICGTEHVTALNAGLQQQYCGRKNVC